MEDQDKKELKQEQSPDAGMREIPDWEESLVKLAIKRSKQYETFVKDEKVAALEDNDFIIEGKQWDEDNKKAREDDGLPCLVFNRAPAFIDRVVGEIRQQPPRARIKAVSVHQKSDLANVLTAICKHIERRSHAERHYMACVEQPITNGYPGFLLITTEYADDTTFNQEIRIEHIVHQFSVKIDPAAMSYDSPSRGGAKWALVEREITRAEFAEEYPEARVVNFEEAVGDQQDWWQRDKVRIASYYVARPKTLTILDYDGLMLEKGSPEEEQYKKANPSITPHKEREINSYEIEHYIISGAEVLKGPEKWPGKFIPVIPVEAKTFWHNGRKRGRGVYRWAKDSGRMRNYWSSKMTESVALATTSPWIATDAMISGKEDEWESKKPKRVLTYTQDPLNPQGRPQRERPPDVPTAAIEMLQLTVDEEKAIVNIDNSSLGRKSNETSGIAIQQRVNESQTAHYPFIANLADSIEFAWRQFIDLVPTVYDTHRIFRNYGDDGKEKEAVEVNKPQVAPDEQAGAAPKPENDLSVVRSGQYEVEVDTGPNQKTQRQEAAQVLSQMGQSNPAVAQLSADLLARSLDFEFSDVLADRLEAALPEEVRALKDSKDENAKMKAQVQSAVDKVQQQAQEAFQAAEAKIQEQQQVIQDLQQKVAQAAEAMNNRAKELELKEKEIESKERIEREKIAAKNGGVESGGEIQKQVHELATAVEELANRKETMQPSQPQAPIIVMAGEKGGEQLSAGITQTVVSSVAPVLDAVEVLVEKMSAEKPKADKKTVTIIGPSGQEYKGEINGGD